MGGRRDAGAIPVGTRWKSDRPLHHAARPRWVLPDPGLRGGKGWADRLPRPRRGGLRHALQGIQLVLGRFAGLPRLAVSGEVGRGHPDRVSFKLENKFSGAPEFATVMSSVY